jgi:hypothetical protein
MTQQVKRIFIGGAALVLTSVLLTTPVNSSSPLAAMAQEPPPPPAMPPPQLDNLVARVALYPDSLLAQILAAATYPNDIAPAADWSKQHSYLRGDELARAIGDDHLPWDPSVQALLPFPTVLDMMARDMNWTTQIGNAFMAQQQDVMDAVQRERHRAYDYGYLRTGPQVIVTPGPYIAIAPVNPAFYYVPVYDPYVVYAAPRPGFFVGGAIHFGGGVTIGAAFAPWGWGHASFAWDRRAVIINDRPWTRTWAGRREYVHPYSVPRYTPERRIEHHDVHREERRDERR